MDEKKNKINLGIFIDKINQLCYYFRHKKAKSNIEPYPDCCRADGILKGG